MVKATWNNKVVAEAEADKCQVVDGNQYFPPEALHSEYFKPSTTTSVCGWKGTASYYTLEVDGQTNKDAAWVYKDPKPAASNIANHVAFWKGVQVQK